MIDRRSAPEPASSSTCTVMAIDGATNVPTDPAWVSASGESKQRLSRACRERDVNSRSPFASHKQGPIDDREWTARMVAALAGDESAYRRLLIDAAKLAASVARRRLRGSPLAAQEAEDVVQETLLAIHAGRSRWRPEAGVAAWVATIARHKAVDAVRRASHRLSTPLDDEQHCLAEPVRETPGTRLDLQRLMAPLQPRQREMITEVMLRGGAVADTARGMRMTPVAGRVMLHRAMRAMAAAANAPLRESPEPRQRSSVGQVMAAAN